MDIRVAENVKRLRKERGMTQEQLAEALGVTVGAVHKWESKQSMPEIRLLVEMAELFQVSVDVLLGYSWQKDSVEQILEKMQAYAGDRNLEEGLPYAERMLKRYPNNFRIVYMAAASYYLAITADSSYARRAIVLMQDAIRLIGQNTDERISQASLENDMAMCHIFLGEIEKAVKIFQKHNNAGQNEHWIGQSLARLEGREQEALEHLSAALGLCYSHLFAITEGYCSVFERQGAYDSIFQLVRWVYEFAQGLRDTQKVNYLDRIDVCLLTLMAAMQLHRDDPEAAAALLKKAWVLALRFDAAPNYSSATVHFYYGPKGAVSMDDMGERAIDIIPATMARYQSCSVLGPLWEEIRHEA